MTDDEKAKTFFEFTNRGFPEPKIKWESLPQAVKAIWIQRMKAKERRK